MLNILLVFGTRPEAIKLAPLALALQARPDEARCRVCVTAQHREMLDQVLHFFKIRPDIDLNLMQPGQSLSELNARILLGMQQVLEAEKPDWVIVQGDTTTSMAASLAAFYQRIPVGHVEAGLRTDQKFSPFPEEINRRITSVIADLHFAPTEQNRDALLREGHPADRIHVTGNTVIDALLWARDQVGSVLPPALANALADLGHRRMVLVTGHRRESFGAGFEHICQALRALGLRYPDTLFVYPVHLNPQVREPVHRILADLPNFRLIAPAAYPEFVWLMNRADLILTDSGGVQEEAPSLGKPVLVLRDTTERREGIDAGTALLVGTSTEAILREASRLLDDPNAHRAMAQRRNPYGDGHAAERIAQLLLTAAR
jgi:UDP-N-acetylglucosamine 2-epimerase (non-hydrolysing)